MFHKCFEENLKTIVVYHLSIKHIAKKYYIVSVCHLRIHWIDFIKTFHFALIPASWDLVYCPIVGNRSSSRSIDFMRNIHINVLAKQVLSKWMHFFEMFCLCSIAELQQNIDMCYLSEKPKKFLRTLFLMFISSCYFI